MSASDESHASVQPPRPARSVGRNFVALLLSQSFTWALATIVASIQPRLIGPTAQGQLRLGFSIWAMAAVVVAFGTSTLTTVQVARNPSVARRLAASNAQLRIVGLIVIWPVVLGFAWLAGYDAAMVRVLVLSGVAASILVFSGTHTAVLHGLSEMGVTARIEVIAKTLTAVLSLAVLAAGGGVISLLVIGIGLTAISGAMLVRSARRLMPPLQPDTPAWPVRRLMRSSISYLLVGGALVVYLQIDTIVISMLVDERAVGWYATADVLFSSLLFVPILLSTAMFPSMVESHSRDPEGSQQQVAMNIRSVLLVAVPIGVGTIIVAKPFVELLYGPEFDGTAAVLGVFGVVIILSCVTIMLGRFALASDRATFWAALMGVAIVISIPLDLVLVSWTERRYDNGAIGGGLAYIVTEAMMVIVGTIVLVPGLICRATMVRVAKLAIASAAMLATGRVLEGANFAALGAATSLGFVVVTIALSTPDAGERDRLGQLVVRARHLIRGRRAPENSR